jgi:hypothetical protein
VNSSSGQSQETSDAFHFGLELLSKFFLGWLGFRKPEVNVQSSVFVG